MEEICHKGTVSRSRSDQTMTGLATWQEGQSRRDHDKPPLQVSVKYNHFHSLQSHVFSRRLQKTRLLWVHSKSTGTLMVAYSQRNRHESNSSLLWFRSSLPFLSFYICLPLVLENRIYFHILKSDRHYFLNFKLHLNLSFI